MELNFGNNLKHLRKSRDLTQDDLALAVGEIFRGLKVRRDWGKVVDKDGGEHFLHGTNGLSGYDRAELHDFLTDPRWAWFNSVREDPRFIAASKLLQK